MMRSPKFDIAHSDAAGTNELTQGFATITAEFAVPKEFPPAVWDEIVATTAPEAIQRILADPQRRDLTDVVFQTLDPAASTDLDQAFSLSEEENGAILLRYAIADVGAFVPHGSATEAEAWHRGETIYAPNVRIPQYPTELCEQAASLLPDGPRPAIVLEVLLSLNGEAVLQNVYRAKIHSSAKYAYETTDVTAIPFLEEFARRVAMAEVSRGAMRTDFPEQQLRQLSDGSFVLELRGLSGSEEANAALSLSANLAVGEYLASQHVGLFRVMSMPEEDAITSLRRLATALHLVWSANQDLAQFQRSLDVTKATHRAFLVAARRAGGGASYATLGCGTATAADLVNGKPYHAAIAGTYAHVTAPLRRLADRYVLELLCVLFTDGVAGVSQPDRDRLAALPAVMRKSGALAASIERASIDLAEAVLMKSHVGEKFAATVLEANETGVVVQLSDPPVRARMNRSAVHKGARAGAEVRVELTSVDVALRVIKFDIADE